MSFASRWVRRRIGATALHTRRARRRFAALGSPLDRRVFVRNPDRITIGERVTVSPYTSISAMINDLPRVGVFDPHIEIHAGTTIGRFCQLSISNRLVIEEDVLITEGVLITDSIHGYDDPTTPIVKQELVSLGPIVIGRGSWIGNGARIVGRVTIGEHSVVGANAYVDRDVPAYSVVVGAPARVVKRFDGKRREWVRVDEPLPPRRTGEP